MALLRASGRHSGKDYQFSGIVEAGGAPSGVAGEEALLTFVDAVIDATTSLDTARDAVVAELGESAMIDSAAVIAGFDAITRVADGSGIPLEPDKAAATAGWRSRLGIDDFWARKV